MIDIVPYVRFPYGNPYGEPGDIAAQRGILQTALQAVRGKGAQPDGQNCGAVAEVPATLDQLTGGAA